MMQEENPASVPVLPPRPNLGPEPWPDEERISVWWVIPAIVPVALAAAWWLRRRRVSIAAMAEVPSDRSAAVITSAGRLIRLVELARAALSRQLDLPWQAMTTEEIGAALPRIEAIGPELRARTIEFFAEADRVKFAGEGVSDDYLVEAESWSADLLRALDSAGARSIQNGR